MASRLSLHMASHRGHRSGQDALATTRWPRRPGGAAAAAVEAFAFLFPATNSPLPPAGAEAARSGWTRARRAEGCTTVPLAAPSWRARRHAARGLRPVRARRLGTSRWPRGRRAGRCSGMHPSPCRARWPPRRRSPWTVARRASGSRGDSWFSESSPSVESLAGRPGLWSRGDCVHDKRGRPWRRRTMASVFAVPWRRDWRGGGVRGPLAASRSHRLGRSQSDSVDWLGLRIPTPNRIPSEVRRRGLAAIQK
jgi:hypothetical protein